MSVIGGQNPTATVTVPVPTPAPMKKPRKPAQPAAVQPVPVNPDSQQQDVPQGMVPPVPQQPEPRAIILPWAPPPTGTPRSVMKKMRYGRNNRDSLKKLEQAAHENPHNLDLVHALMETYHEEYPELSQLWGFFQNKPDTFQHMKGKFTGTGMMGDILGDNRLAGFPSHPPGQYDLFNSAVRGLIHPKRWSLVDGEWTEPKIKQPAMKKMRVKFGRATPENVEKLGQAVKDNPDNEDLRQAWADEIEESGDHARADVIRNGPRSIEVHGRRWFRRGPGNTYHTARVVVDGQDVPGVPMQYGYGDQYMQNATEQLEKLGHIKNRKKNEYGGGDPLWRWAQHHGVKFTYSVQDVPRQRDLHQMSRKYAKSRVMTVPIERIVPEKDNMETAVHSLHNGRDSVTPDKPLKVDRIAGSRLLSLADGHHRLLRGILDGDTHIDVVWNDNDGLGPSVYPKRKDHLKLNPDEEHFGLGTSLENGWLLNRISGKRNYSAMNNNDPSMDFGMDAMYPEGDEPLQRPAPKEDITGRTRKQILQQMLEAAKKGYYDPAGMTPRDYIADIEGKNDVPQGGGDVFMSDDEDELPPDQSQSPKQYNRKVTYPRLSRDT